MRCVIPKLYQWWIAHPFRLHPRRQQPFTSIIVAAGQQEVVRETEQLYLI